MKQRNRSTNTNQKRTTNKKLQNRTRSSSKKKEVAERKLDEAIKMTFPASDPIAITPEPDVDPTQSNNSALPINNK